MNKNPDFVMENYETNKEEILEYIEKMKIWHNSN